MADLAHQISKKTECYDKEADGSRLARVDCKHGKAEFGDHYCYGNDGRLCIRLDLAATDVTEIKRQLHRYGEMWASYKSEVCAIDDYTRVYWMDLMRTDMVGYSHTAAGRDSCALNFYTKPGHNTHTSECKGRTFEFDFRALSGGDGEPNPHFGSWHHPAEL